MKRLFLTLTAFFALLNLLLAQPLLSESIYFQPGKFALTPASKEALKQFVEKIPDKKICYLVVNGFTDSDGSFDYNNALSRRRASSVSKNLVELGIKED